MRALDMLTHEHRIIDRVLEGFGTYVDELERGDDPPLEDLAQFAIFFREFADRCHHGKEEGILFARMAEYGFSNRTGPVAVMLHEHAEGRGHVQALAEAARQPAWTPKLREEVVAHGRAYIHLLSAHIQKEDVVLYPMAARGIPEDRMEAMAAEFDDFEENVTGKDVHEQYHRMAHELAERSAGKVA